MFCLSAKAVMNLLRQNAPEDQTSGTVPVHVGLTLYVFCVVEHVE